MIDGGVEVGPNAVWAFKREGYQKWNMSLNDMYDSLSWKGFRKLALKHWSMGMDEYKRSFSKKAFVQALQKLIPTVQEKDLVEGGAGVRAQACDKDGNLIDDFKFIEGEHAIHVCNAPSPAATSSLAIGDYISQKALERFL